MCQKAETFKSWLAWVWCGLQTLCRDAHACACPGEIKPRKVSNAFRDSDGGFKFGFRELKAVAEVELKSILFGTRAAIHSLHFNQPRWTRYPNSRGGEWWICLSGNLRRTVRREEAAFDGALPRNWNSNYTMARHWWSLWNIHSKSMMKTLLFACVVNTC